MGKSSDPRGGRAATKLSVPFCIIKKLLSEHITVLVSHSTGQLLACVSTTALTMFIGDILTTSLAISYRIDTQLTLRHVATFLS